MTLMQVLTPKSYKTSDESFQHDAGNGVIGGTISITWQGNTASGNFLARTYQHTETHTIVKKEYTQLPLTVAQHIKNSESKWEFSGEPRFYLEAKSDIAATISIE